MAPDKVSSPTPARTSVSLPLSPGCQESQASKPRSPAAPKFQSPKQLLTSWLKTNSRKRTHSDSDDKTDHEIQSLKSESSSELTLKVTDNKSKLENTLQNVEQPSLTSQENQIHEEYGTKDTMENGSNGQKSPSVSPLKKRLCVDDPSNSTAHNQDSVCAKPNRKPGKENQTLDNCSSEEAKQDEVKRDEKCKQTSGATSNQHVTTKSNCQNVTPTRTKNWLTEWSLYCKAKYGETSISLPKNGNESSITTKETLDVANNVTEDNSGADDIQLCSAQVSICFSWKYLKAIGLPGGGGTPI